MNIAILSPKGGCGKSTTALALASVFAHNPDLSVAIIDADPRQNLAKIWQNIRDQGGKKAAPFTLLSSIDPDGILDTLEDTQTRFDLAFIDIEGIATVLASYAASASDFCIIPMRPSLWDVMAANDTRRMIKTAGKSVKRDIPSRVLFTQTDAALTTRSHSEIARDLDQANVPRFETELIRRAPFERMVAEGLTLLEMDKTQSVVSATNNAVAIAQELSGILEELE